MADGKITGRLIRENIHQHANGNTATLYLTLAKSRGSGASDFLTLEVFIDKKQSSKNRVNLLQKIANESTLVEVSYNLKSRTYQDNNGDNVYKKYIQLLEFDILESKQAVKDRLNHHSKKEEIPSETEAPSFDPEASGAFVENNVSENLKDNTPETTDEGKYGNPFE